jgi:hypothetical protein
MVNMPANENIWTGAWHGIGTGCPQMQNAHLKWAFIQAKA